MTYQLVKISDTKLKWDVTDNYYFNRSYDLLDVLLGEIVIMADLNHTHCFVAALVYKIVICCYWGAKRSKYLKTHEHPPHPI